MKVKRKFLVGLILLVMSLYSFANGVVLDPNSRHNTKLDEAHNGTPIVNISTPNNRGVSLNEFLEYNIDSRGQILNNADNTGRSHLGGLINANPNLGPNQAAGLIVLQVNGANKSKIEGYLEALSRKKVDVILSNENGIYFNNSGTINIRKFTATTGKIKLKDGDYIGIDVKRGNIAIGEKGLDLTNADYVEILSKTLEIAGNVVAKDEMKIIAGTNEVSKDGKITKNNSASPAEVAIDASALGGMYANTVKIISTEKGAGVNSSSFIISKDKELEITADGKVKLNKVQGNGVKVEAREFEQNELTHSTKSIDIKAEKIKTAGITQAEKEINLDGNVENSGSIYTKKYLNTKSLKNSGNIQIQKEIKVNGKLSNSGDIQTQKELVVARNTDNNGIIEAQSRIKIGGNLDNNGKVYTNDKLSAENVKNSKDIVVIKNISIKKLENSGNILSDEKVDIDGSLTNSGKVQVSKDILVNGDIVNNGKILSNATLTAKNTKNTKDIIIKEKIDILNTDNSGTIATSGTLNIDGNLKNTGIVSANKEIQVQKDIENDGQILTDSSLKAKDIVNTKDIVSIGDIEAGNVENEGVFETKGNITLSGNIKNIGQIYSEKEIVAKNVENTNKITGIGNINVDNVNNSGSIVSEGSLNISGKLENTDDIQAKGNINVKDNLKNSGEIKSLKSLEAQNIKNINKILVNENVTTNNLENTGTLGVGERLLANESLNNTKTIEAGNIEAKNKFLENKGDIKAETILVDALNVKNDGNILVIDDVKIDTNKFENNKNIESLKDILINSKFFSNSGKIASNNKIDVNNPKFQNSGEILSNYIKLNNLEDFKNSGSIKGTDVKVVTSSDIDLIGTIHGENNLSITGKNIINNGKTLGNGDFFLNTEKFINNKDLLFKNININSKGDIENNSVINSDVISISSNNFVNNDLIAALNNANIISKGKITNNEGKTIFAGNNLNIQAKEMLNSKGELLGKNISIIADYLKNDIGLIQAENDIHISSLKFENIGESLDLDRYESYYVTWDGKIIEESEIDNWNRQISPHIKTRRGSGGSGSKVRRDQRKAYKEVVDNVTNDKYKSLLFPKYTELVRGYLGNEGEYTEKTGSARIQDIPLLEKARSLGKTNYAKVQAGNNILIDSKIGNVGEVVNKDAIISAGNNVEIKADKVLNITSVGEKVKVKTGEESIFIKYHRKKRRFRGDKISGQVTYSRGFANDYITKKVKKLDENGKPVMRKRFGRLRPVYVKVTEYIGRYAYVTGKPSIIEGKNIIIDNSKIVKQGIEEANGNINSGRVENSLIDKAFDITTGTSSTNQNLTFDRNLNNKGTLDILARTEVVSNTRDIENIIKTGKIDILPENPSALFIKNVSPDAKYVLETRIKYTSIGNYYGSDYFLSRIGYEEKWDRVKRLGDAYYENSLIDKNISDKLGTRFLNGEIVSMKNLIDNAKDESIKLGLKIGEPLSTEQKENLSKDIVWYELGEFSGEKVLIPKVYLSKKTLSTINGDSRTKIVGTNLVNIQSNELYNSGLIGSNETTFVKGNNIFNRTLTNQIGEIKGNKTTLVAAKDIENIGGKLLGKEELTLISKDGDILNSATTSEFNQNFGEVNRSEYSQIKNVGEISSEGKLDIVANNYISTSSKTNAKDLNILAKEDVKISSQEVSGEQKFGKDGNNFNSYAFESNIGSNINSENLNINAKNLNIKGSAVITKNANLTVDRINIDSNVDKIDTESRSKSKGFLSSHSKTEIQHSENNIAGTLYVENKGIINGDVNVVGSNLVLGKNSYIAGKLTTDSKATYNKYIFEEKKKGLSFSLSKNSFNLAYGKNQFNYDEKDKTNIKSNLVLGDGTVLNKGAEITATNFNHGNIAINNGDVIYGARKDEREVKISTKKSSFGISGNVSSPALERAKQGVNALKQIGNGDALGGLVNVGNVVTGTVDGLASNIKTKSGTQATAEDIQNNNFISNNNFYIQAGISTGYSKSKQESKSHTEKAVVTDIKGLDENAKITYNDSKNIKYQGTQAQDTTFVYNNVENITKEAVKLNNYYKSKGNSSGIGLSVGLTGNEPSISLNVNASKNKLNTDETVYQNGSFVNVNEVHNNTKNMQLSGFTQIGGKVTGNIENLNIESKQNTSKTKGDTKGANLGVNLLSVTPSGSISASRTSGNRNFVDNQSTFVVGKDSNLKIGNVDNTASIIGTADNGKIVIENYTGKNLENSDKLKTVGGSVGTSGAGFNYSNSEKEGIARNTVVGNVEIEKSSGDTINRDLSKANEITKDSSSSTNVYVEDNLVKAITNPEEFKNKIEVAKIEVDSLKGTVTKTVENIIVGDKSQDKGNPERRSLTEIKESIIRTQTAPEIELIAKEKDFSSKEVLEKLKIKAIEKFDVNSSKLPEGVKERKEELNAENKELVAFYDETTNKIFISKDIKDKAEIRALIAREWKISEDLKDKKGKSNDKGELRATVAGEIAYEEIKSRAKKGEVSEFNISKLNDAVMDKDSVVTSDRYLNKTRGEIERQIANINYYYNVINNENARAETIGKDEEFDKKNLEYKAEYEKKLANIDKVVQISELEEHYRIIEIPRLEEKLSTVKDKNEKKALESRLNLLKDERDTLEGFLRSNNLINKNLLEGLAEGGAKGLIKGAIFEVGSKISNVPSSALMFLTMSTELNNYEDSALYMLNPISKEEAKYISENFPEYYYAHRIGERVEENQISWDKEKRNASIADFYKNSRGVLAKEIGNSIGEVAGFTAGGIATDKGINTVNKLVNQGGIIKGVNTTLPAIPNEKTSFISNNGSIINNQKLLPVSANREIIKPDFYVGPSGASSTLPSTAYRYMDSKWYDTTKETMSGPLSYFGFEKFDNAYQVRDGYQIAYDYYNRNNIPRVWSDTSIRGRFDTLQLYDNNKGIPSVGIPKTYGDNGKEFKPFTISYAEYQGRALSSKTVNKTIPETIKANSETGNIIGKTVKNTDKKVSSEIKETVVKNIDNKVSKVVSKTANNSKKHLLKKEDTFENIISMSSENTTYVTKNNLGAKLVTENAYKLTDDTSKYASIIDDIIKNGDPTGIKIEKIVNDILRENSNFVILNGKYGSNNGIDHLFLNKKTGEMWVIDSKQIGKAKTYEAGAIRVAENAAKDQRQLSENWIKAVANKLPKEEKNILESAIKDKKIRTGVIGVNKETEDILFIPIKIKNKSRKQQ
ncbi:hemagglutinin repeat-containing protein [Fusobacterium sp. DD12]